MPAIIFPGYIITIILLCLLPFRIFANATESVDFQKSIHLFESQKYTKALPYLKKLAEEGNQASMYRLAYLYEHGLGVSQNYEKAMYWYKKAAKKYAYTVNGTGRGKGVYAKSFSKRLKAQFTEYSLEAAGNACITKLNTDTPETRSFLDDLTNGRFFGLTPYKANYILPFSHASKQYRKQPAGTKSFTIADAIVPMEGLDRVRKYGKYEKRTEVEFQFSLKKNLTYNIFGFGECITAAYTQHSFWQLYSESSPFRDTNYAPELYIAFPASPKIDRVTGLKAVKWGFIHQSNGQEGYRSRSWNRLYTEGLFQWGNLFVNPRIWYRIPEKDKSADYYRGYIDTNGNGHPDPADKLMDPDSQSGLDDNPDIVDYMGYGDLSMSYLWHRHQIGALLRYNFGKNGHTRGAVKLDWSYPFFDSRTMFWYFKFFTGYGESLIDYNHDVTKTSFGFAFSRGLLQ